MTLFQARLKKAMDDKHVKAIHIVRATGISAGAISKYLSNENKKAEFEYILKIAFFLNVDPNWLGGLTDEQKPFIQSTIVDIYEQLSETSKKQVYDFALFLLNSETIKQGGVIYEA